MCKTVLPGMIKMGGGSIVNVASVWGWTGIKNNVAYQTAKAAAVLGEALGGVAREDPVVVAAPPGGQLGLQPRPHLGAEPFFVGAPGQVHTAGERI